jgi:hypothetical protein
LRWPSREDGCIGGLIRFYAGMNVACQAFPSTIQTRGVLNGSSPDDFRYRNTGSRLSVASWHLIRTSHRTSIPWRFCEDEFACVLSALDTPQPTFRHSSTARRPRRSAPCSLPPPVRRPTPRRSSRDRQSQPGHAPQDLLPCGPQCKTSGDSYVTIDLTRCPPNVESDCRIKPHLGRLQGACVHPQLVARYNRSAGRLSKSCFVSRNIFGVGEYYSTSGVVHIAGTKIIGKRIAIR